MQHKIPKQTILNSLKDFRCFFHLNNRYATGILPAEVITEQFNREELKQFAFCSAVHPLLYSTEEAEYNGDTYSFFTYYCFFNDEKYALDIELLSSEPKCEGTDGYFIHMDENYAIVLLEHRFTRDELDMYAFTCNIWFRGSVEKEEFENIIYLSADGWECSLSSCEHLGNDDYECKLKLKNEIKEETASVFINKREHTTSSDNLKNTMAKDEELAVMFYVVELLF